MGWDGSGGFDREHNWVNDRDAAIDITASRMDAEFDNYATGLEACLNRNGENSPSANIPMGGFKFTGVAAASAAGEFLRYQQLINTQTIFVPAAGLRPTVSNGSGFTGATETTSGRPDIVGAPFDDTSQEYAQFQIAMPKQWNEGTITAQFFWTGSTASATGVVWGIQGVSCGDSDTIDVAYGTAQEVTDTHSGTAEDIMVSAASSAITIAGAPAVDEMCFFRVYRDPTNGADTYADDAILIGIKLFYTIDAGNDA